MLSIYQGNAEVEVRERRLHSTLSYSGTALDLLEKGKNKELACKGRYYGQCGNCAEGCAETVTTHIRGSAVISHAPVGCASLAGSRNVNHRSATKSRGFQQESVHYISSNIEEKDTVYGAAEKLRLAIREADRRFKPTAIFIQASCASGIIGEDLESIANEAEKELGYPIVPIYCEGFKSRIWSSGFDAGFHGILRKLVKEPEKKQTDLVNVFNFEGSDTFTPLFERLGLRVNYVAPLADAKQLAELSEAACTAHICETLATYIGAALEEKFGVPEIKAPSPFGINWTDAWLRELGKYTNKEDEVEQLIVSEHERIQPELEELKEKLKGKKVYVISGNSFAHNISNITKDLGLEIAGFTTLHYDQHTDSEAQANTLEWLVKGTGDIKNVTVCNKQPYQLVKILKKVKPDLLIVRHGGLTTLGLKLGIPTLFEGDANYSIAYEGVLRLGRRFYEALRTYKFVKNVASHAELPYTDWWLEEEPDPFYFEGGKKK